MTRRIFFALPFAGLFRPRVYMTMELYYARTDRHEWELVERDPLMWAGWFRRKEP